MVRSIIFFWRLYVVESASMYSFIQLLIMYILSQEIRYVLDGISFLIEHICTEDRKALKHCHFPILRDEKSIVDNIGSP